MTDSAESGTSVEADDSGIIAKLRERLLKPDEHGSEFECVFSSKTMSAILDVWEQSRAEIERIRAAFATSSTDEERRLRAERDTATEQCAALTAERETLWGIRDRLMRECAAKDAELAKLRALVDEMAYKLEEAICPNASSQPKRSRCEWCDDKDRLVESARPATPKDTGHA